MEVYEMSLADLNTKDELSIQVAVDESETSEEFVIRATIDGQEITSSGDSYLAAYQDFRDNLLAIGYGIKCNGSRINAVQSNMLSVTDKVYLVKMGKQALTEDIVHIWDHAEIDAFPDTTQQNAFFEQWLKR